MQIKTTMSIISIWSESPLSKSTNNKCLRGYGEKGNPLTLLERIDINTTAMDNSMEISLKTRNKTTIQPNSLTT